MSTNSLFVSTARVIGASPSSSSLSPNDPNVTTALTQVRKTSNSADISLGTIDAIAAMWDAGDDDFLEVIARLLRAVDDVESGTERSIRYRRGETSSGVRHAADVLCDPSNGTGLLRTRLVISTTGMMRPPGGGGSFRA
jgi:hypothetical protein